MRDSSVIKCVYIALFVVLGAIVLNWLFRGLPKDRFAKQSDPRRGGMGDARRVPVSSLGYQGVGQDRDFLPLPGRPPTYGYWQGLAPSLRVENDYHACMGQECGANYQDYRCRQKCYLKTMKNGTTDRADLICARHRNNEEAYYTCLDTVYGRSIGMDRSVGTADTCGCGQKNGINLTGIVREDGQCLCPPETPLSDRRLRGNDWDVVGPMAMNQNALNL